MKEDTRQVVPCSTVLTTASEEPQGDPAGCSALGGTPPGGTEETQLEVVHSSCPHSLSWVKFTPESELPMLLGSVAWSFMALGNQIPLYHVIPKPSLRVEEQPQREQRSSGGVEKKGLRQCSPPLMSL